MESPIFCSNCKFLHIFRSGCEFLQMKYGGMDDYECHCPENCIVYTTWFHKKVAWQKHPSDMNLNNDCPHFVAK